MLHPDCPHQGTIAIGGAVAVSHQRPGDARPHIDFMLPDGTLDCRFDDFCDALADGGEGACCHAPGLVDAAEPGAFATAARQKPVVHGDHVHRLSGVASPGCGALWPANLSDAELDFAALFDGAS